MWGFTVKRGATTIHEDSAPYTVSASSFIVQVEAVTHALCWIASRGDNHTTHAIIFSYSVKMLEKLKVEWEAQTGNVNGPNRPS